MKKIVTRLITAALASVMMLSLYTPVGAANVKNYVTVKVDGKVVTTEAYVDQDNRTQLPLSAVQALGMSAKIEKGNMTITKATKIMNFKIGEVMEDTTVVADYVPLAYLAENYGYKAVWDGATRSVNVTKNTNAPDASLITSIQPHIEANINGYKCGSIDITYKPGTDMSGVEPDAYVVYDRGFSNPNFGELEITHANVKGNVVTLLVDMGSDKVLDRSRESYGLLATSKNWSVTNSGKVLVAAEEETVDALGITLHTKASADFPQRRKNLDLVLCVNTSDITKGIRSTDGAGTMLENTVWKEATLPNGLDELKLELVDVGWKAEGYELLSDEGLVPVFVNYPENYDPNREEPYPLINYQHGGGSCYREFYLGTPDEITNLGVNTAYDPFLNAWHEAFPDCFVVSIMVHGSPTENSAAEVAGALDYMIANWNVDPERIVTMGNSQGTLITSEMIRQRPDLLCAFVESNGDFGVSRKPAELDGTLANSSFGKWSQAEVDAIVANEVAVWMFNGETDSNPATQQDTVELYKDLYRKAGKTEEWIDAHVRASGLQSWQFKMWGETDHSVSRLISWKYLTSPYVDVYQDRLLQAGDTYQFTGLELNHANYPYTMDYTYKVYDESVAEWIRDIFAEKG